MKKIIELIEASRIIPVLQINDILDTIPLISALMDGGFKAVEITLRTPHSFEAIQRARQISNLIVGAGTVINLTQAKQAIASGAQFIVSPGFDEEIINYCHEYDVLTIPGCLTPTEIMKAIKKNIQIIKYFPAESHGGVNAIKSFSSVFKDIRFIPTGGINLSNLIEYLSLKNVIACGGSWMAKDEDIKAKRFCLITEISKQSLMNAKGVIK